MMLDAQSTAQPMARPDNGPAHHVTTPARLTAVIAAFCFALPLIAIVASPGVVPLLLIAALLAGLAVWRSEERLPKPDRGLALAFGALLLWCAVASLWSFEPASSLVLTLRIGVIFAAALLLHGIVRALDGPARRRIGGWLAAGVVLGLALMAAEIALGFPIARLLHGPISTDGAAAIVLNRGAVALAILCWPTAAFLWRRFGSATALALPAALLLVLSFLNSLSAGLGLISGAAVAVLAGLWPKSGRILVASATLAAMIGSPVAGKVLYDLNWQNARWLPASAQHRVEIWHFTAERIAERPLAGWGFDMARAMERLPAEVEQTGRSPVGLHPHNAPLQILFELGLVGAAIALVLVWMLIRRLEEIVSPHRAFAQATYTSTLVVACVGFGIWQNQWLTLMACAAIGRYHLQHPFRPTGPGGLRE